MPTTSGVLTDLGNAVGKATGGTGPSKSSGSKPVQNKTDYSTGYDPSNTEGFKKGGKVRKTGLAKVHKGERVLNRKQARKYEAKKR